MIVPGRALNSVLFMRSGVKEQESFLEEVTSKLGPDAE